MALPLSINAADPGHIGDHEEIHAFLSEITSGFTVGQADAETYANRPAAGLVGRFWYATDTGEVFFDTGSSWVTIRPGASAAAAISTQETTSSTAYTDLATSGPSVTVVVGDSGKVQVGIVSVLGLSTLNGTHGQPRMSFEASGANTISAGDDHAVGNDATDTTAEAIIGAVFTYTGLARGSTTFTAKYRGGDPSDVLKFRNRRIWATPLAN